MTILYAGDWHGRVNNISSLLQSAESKHTDDTPVTIIQVGDMGSGFPDGEFEKFLHKRARQGKFNVKVYTPFGNHDNWDQYDERCKEDPNSATYEIVRGSGFYVVKRGHVISIDGINHIFMGGAESTDKHHRTEGETWWAREEPNAEEFNLLYDNLQVYKPEVMVAHEAPHRIPLSRDNRECSYTPSMLERIIDLSDHKISRYFFGHFHDLDKWVVDDVEYYCCGWHGEYVSFNPLTNKPILSSPYHN